MIYEEVTPRDENGEFITEKTDYGFKYKTKKVKLTPNQYAKKMLLKKMEHALASWAESEYNLKDFTDLEIEQINEQMEKRYYSLKKYLGL